MSPARVALSTGVADAGIASLATFLGGLYAAATLTGSELGIYGLFFSGFVLAGVVPAQLVFTPLEVRLNSEYEPLQLRALRRTVLLGGVPSLFASVAVATLVILVSDGDADLLFAVGLTTIAASTLSPIQDHVRRVLHQANRSSWALATSVSQFVVILAAIAIMWNAGVDRAWIPMGALAIANAVSLTVAMALAQRAATTDRSASLRLRESARVGSWLMYSTLAQSGALFLALIFVQKISSVEEVGYFEAARQISQPVFVLGTGLMAVLRPQVMSAAQSGNASLGKRPKRQFMGLLGVTALLWMLLAGFTSFSPIRFLLDQLSDEISGKAYAVSGLVAGITLGAALWSMTLILAAELTAGGRERGVFAAHLSGSVAMLTIVALTASSLGAWAIPIGVIAQSAVAAWVYRGQVRALYRPTEESAIPAEDPGCTSQLTGWAGVAAQSSLHSHARDADRDARDAHLGADHDGGQSAIREGEPSTAGELAEVFKPK